MRPLVIAIATLASCAGKDPPPPPPPAALEPAPTSTLNEALRDEIQAMFAEDQKLRRRLATGDIENPPPELLEEGRAVDARNRARLAEIIDEHGWPGESLVGDEAAGAAVFLAIHADRDLDFQRRCLELMNAGDVDKPSLALMIDRVRTNEGKKQLYGTQAELVDGKLVPTPIEDPEHVDQRRAEMEMPPLAEFLEMQQAHYDTMRRTH